ncbi:MAG: hypothetical protein A2Z34_01850 [Planctomycetes bacterium RBG_16_59_8]|nr:MAG: hypothetical protein A2Z34_01850 [Planctomycetes bacterium RBG_16_59_8]
MICLVCREAMVVVEQKGIELDYCPRCRGVWFDRDELNLLLESLEFDTGSLKMNDLLTLPEKAGTERERKCPLCRKRMAKSAVGNEPEVIVDRCVNNEGFWFDGGEVGQVIRQLAGAKTGSPGKAISFLGEVFQAARP